MGKVDSAIKRETCNIALMVLILSALMESVYLVLGEWGLPVLFGNLLGGSTGVVNFFLMGIGLQSALKKDSKDAKTTVSFSHTYRHLLIVVVIVLAVFISWFDLVATIVSVFFASVGIYLRVFLIKKNGVGGAVASEGNTSDDESDVTDMKEENE